MIQTNQQKLIGILQLAYSGELAPSYAYRGHWHSVRSEDERNAIRRIEDDEWRHRRLVGDMLASLGVGPSKAREIRARLIGRALGMLCHVAGWLAPMYGAGKLESRNIREYEIAARHARDSGHTEFIDCLLEMAEVEWDHEFYFRGRVLSRTLGRRLPLWPRPPSKQTIRLSFETETAANLIEDSIPTLSARATTPV